MRRTTWLFAATIAVLAACSNDTTAPATLLQEGGDGIDLVQDLDVSTASVVDRAGIGGSELPDSLKLTAEQKAKIAALHEAYQAAFKADLDAVKAIEAEAHAARRAGKSRAEIAAIIAKAEPILARVRSAFAKLQADIWAVYTAAQQTWIRTRHPADTCRNDSTPRLTEAQIQKIRALKAAFQASIQDELQTIRQVYEEAKAARAAGASQETIKRILAKADAAMQAIREAEQRLKNAINDVLTPEQRRNPCVLRGLNG